MFTNRVLGVALLWGRGDDDRGVGGRRGAGPAAGAAQRGKLPHAAPVVIVGEVEGPVGGGPQPRARPHGLAGHACAANVKQQQSNNQSINIINIYLDWLKAR